MAKLKRRGLAVFALISWAGLVFAAENNLGNDALRAMKKAAAYFTEEVATHGGYLWTYSQDLTQRAGEGRATASQIWVQPPGTPSVGMAFVRAYEATGDKQFLDAAVAAGKALAWGQLESGGWDYRIDFSPRGSQRWFYRRQKDTKDPNVRRRRNTSTLDDNNTQSALMLLMALDQLVDDAEIREATRYGLDALLKAQYPNGGWPQRFFVKPPTKQRTFKYTKIGLDGKATVHEAPRSYAHYHTFNDNTINDCVAVCLEAYRRYGEKRFIDRARLAGDFMILSQLPSPQEGWAQQYTLDIKPEWARKFEPPSVCSAVTYRNIKTLMDIYVETGDDKYLKPIPAAIGWLRRSRLTGRSKKEEGKWARFYELGTNLPLYFTKDKYELVYTADNMPTHYAFLVGPYNLDGLEAQYQRLLKTGGREKILQERKRSRTKSELLSAARRMEAKVKSVLSQQDERGRWVTGGQISCGTFNRNMNTLSAYLGSLRKAQDGR